MAQSIQLIEATVKYGAGKVFTTQYGDRINAVAVTAQGEEVKLWGNPNDPTLTSLRKGQTVQLAKDTKGYKLVSQPESTSTNGNGKSASQWQPWSDEEKRLLATKINSHADLLGYCLKVASEKLGDYCTNSEDLRALAITLYLQSLK